MSDMLTSALAYAKAGIRVLPLHWITGKGVCSCNNEKCKTPGKHPFSAHGVDDATTVVDQIKTIWGKNPYCNIGITPGPLPDGRIWFVLDLDQGIRTRNGKRVHVDGAGQLADLEDEFGENVPRKIEQISGSGGTHIILARPAGTRKPKKLGSGIDTIAEGTYIVAAPSNHLSGNDYEWIEKKWMPDGTVLDNLPEILTAIPDAPQWVLDYDQPGTPRQGERQTSDARGDDLRAMSRKLDGLTEEDFEEAVMTIPNKGDGQPYDTYVEMLFAIKFETDGSDDGLALAHRWASQSDKYEPADLDRRWDSVHNDKSASRMKTGRFILKLAQDAGYEMPAQTDIGRAIQRINRDHAFVVMGGRHKIVYETRADDGVSGLDFLEERTFRAKFVNEKYEVPAPTKGEPDKVKDTSIGDIWFASKLRRQYINGVAFEPNLAKAKAGIYNLFGGFAVPPSRHADPYKYCWRVEDHVYEVLANGNEAHGDWIMAWFAQILQEPWNKLGTALVLAGKPGTGKSIVGDIMRLILGRYQASASRPEDILTKFNSALSTALMVQMEEAFWAGTKELEGTLKHLITTSSLRMELKGVDAIESHNYTRILLTSNNKWVVPAGLDERRFAAFWVSEKRMQDKPHFQKMWDQMANGGIAAWHQRLREFDRSKVDLRQIPMTPLLARQKLESAPPMALFALDLITEESREVWPEHDGSARIECDRLLGLVKSFYSERHFHYKGTAHAAQELKEWLPEMITRRPGAHKATGRTRVYEFGNIRRCRESLNEKFKIDLFTDSNIV